MASPGRIKEGEKKLEGETDGRLRDAISTHKYEVGIYNKIRGVPGLDAHHVGQKAVMKSFIPNYDPETAPAILVPKVGHTIMGSTGILSRSTQSINNIRQLLARDISELRRVYPDIPNSQLQKLIDLNRKKYPQIGDGKL